MIRRFPLAAVLVCLLHHLAIAEPPPVSWSVVVPDDATASMLPPLPDGARLSVLFRDDSESEHAMHSRAFELRFANYFVYRSGSESPLSAIYRERLQNHGAAVIDLRTVSQPSRLGPSKPQPFDGLAIANLFRQH